MKYCFCCSGILLRHVQGAKIYWFCSDCRQEMPDLIKVAQIAARRCDREAEQTREPTVK